MQKGRLREGQIPARGVVEVKGVGDDAWLTADGEQVSRYWSRYQLVLVTNTRDFVLVGMDAAGRPSKLETFRLADSAEAFDRRLEKPRAFADDVGAGLGEYLSRVLSHRAALAEPKDLAWLLASYARDGLARVEAAGDTASLKAVRSALEEALGVHFEGEKGARFFHSTLVQTLFYGLFSAWVLWARQTPPPSAKFNWHDAVWHLRAPVLRALFQQLSDPGRLQPLGLVEVLDWTSAALDRVDRSSFFTRFREGEAVPYFYEPFLESFDPHLRKQLGVWYTPTEVVRYMVARVDKALKDDLDIPDGLAAENVYVLDPCCGTGVPWCINTGKSLIPLTLLFLHQKRNLLIPLELSRVMHQGIGSTGNLGGHYGRSFRLPGARNWPPGQVAKQGCTCCAGPAYFPC